MNKLLMDNRPKDLSKEKWEELWNNQGYTLEPLFNVLKSMAKNYENPVKEEDFSNPNHYGLMVSRASKLQILQQVMDMLPQSAKSN